ncbi:MAG TPA: hypothetical protein VHO23_02755 [Candidatus Paceibacterota bacterium]|nr:hypothetical protein [Candidatus Paceibacterota bacterium]
MTPNPQQQVELPIMLISVSKKSARFTRIRIPRAPDTGIGTFFMRIDMTAMNQTIYVPTSIASSKKPTGFVYRIEGTAEGAIVKADVSAQGDGIAQITVGTIVYTKIPAGMTASFRVLIDIKGRVPKSYQVVVHRINYKRNLNDTRYESLLQEIGSKILKFN